MTFLSSIHLQIIVLLTLSRIFMTLAWYGHLKKMRQLAVVHRSG